MRWPPPTPRVFFSALSPRVRKTLLIAAIAVAVLIAATPAIFAYTERSRFCLTCHEMAPYYDAWAVGDHQRVECVDCHITPGVVSHVSHKFVALKEVISHFQGDDKFPREHVELPPDACKRCHRSLPQRTVRGFEHGRHRGIECSRCHPNAGHEVRFEVLAREGFLAEGAPRTGSKTGWVFETARNTLPGHRGVVCARCHDLARTACAQCHTAPHDDRGQCGVCHMPDGSFVFVHPGAKSACQDCHERPRDHYDDPCWPCHTDTGKSWAYSHPAAGSMCVDCHKRPVGHWEGRCLTCHKRVGESWAFAHPASSSTCTDCHTRPSDHAGPPCTRCHRTGVDWRFRHPASSTTCTDCHDRPRNHQSGPCTSCHRTGVSWAFRHPSSRDCAECHRAPANHFGPRCSSCHSPSRAFSRATFRHPRVPGGEHSYRSFECNKCHPVTNSLVNCTCHGGKAPDEDDD